MSATNNNNTKRNVWFITGTSTGLGRAFAEYAIQQNYQVVVSARNVATVQDLVQKDPKNVLAVKLDVNSIDDIKAALQAAVDRFGGIDVLINNAGYALIGALEETSEQLLRDQFNTNFFGAIAVTREVLPILRAQKSGAIVQISSLVGSLSFAGFGAYSATKFALEGFSEALAGEVAPFGIKVLIAKPGMFRTEITNGKNPMTPSIGVYDDHPAGQLKHFNAVHGTQAGDPHRAAIAIDQALQAENTPLRLLLGTDSADKTVARLESQLAEYKAWDTVARSTDFPEGN
jgi:NAD(P)-dependent dehydrogenase (short-subunit alcohol dehydrogenase family)